MTAEREPIKGWIVALMGGTALLGLSICWAALPVAGAVISTACAFLGFEFGKSGARWYDERNKL